MSQSPSILITYHNEGPLLQRCLASLAAQTRPVQEVIVYDDASSVRPDGYVDVGVPVRIIRGEANIGPARARNVLLRSTDAEFVHFHDADDVFDPAWNESVSAELAWGRPDAVFTEVSSVTESGVVRDGILGLSHLDEHGDLIRFCIQGSMLVPAGTYRRDLVRAIGGYRESLWQSEDWDFHIRLACARPAYRVLSRCLVRIYLRGASRSRDTAQVWQSALDAIRTLAGEVPRGYLTDLSEAAARAGSHLFRAGAAAEARQAFDLARTLGTPVHRGEAVMYRAVARHAGQEWAERLGMLYRRYLPGGLRRLARHRA